MLQPNAPQVSPNLGSSDWGLVLRLISPFCVSWCSSQPGRAESSALPPYGYRLWLFFFQISVLKVGTRWVMAVASCNESRLGWPAEFGEILSGEGYSFSRAEQCSSSCYYKGK